MFATHTLILTYDAERGEPRGSRGRKVDPRAAGLGDCVDCNICVQVCPTGIDIRDGLQIECIGCAACIDGCDQVMGKMGYPKGLIRYTTQNALAKGYDKGAMWRRVFRLRTIVYSAVLLAVATAGGVSLATRNPLKVDILRDRGALAREASPGVIENVYRVQIMNTDEVGRRFTIRADGFPGLEVVGVDQPVDLGPAQSRVLPLRLRAPAPDNAATIAKAEPHPIEFIVQAVGDDKVVRHEKSTFIVPRQ
jgi:cytochrome c oxidase accessory protein FixG